MFLISLFYRRKRLKSSLNSVMSSSPKSRRVEFICKYCTFYDFISVFPYDCCLDHFHVQHTVCLCSCSSSTVQNFNKDDLQVLTVLPLLCA